MKKIVSMLLALMIIITMFVGCDDGSQDSTTPTNNTNSTTIPTNGEDVGEKGEEEESQNSYILSLQPTHTTASAYPFKDWEFWSVEQPINDIDHLTNGYYSFEPQDPTKYGFGPTDVTNDVTGTWEKIKDLPVNDVEKYSEYRPLLIHSDDSNACIVWYDFEPDLPEDMTIEEAYEQGYWQYTKSNQNGWPYTMFFDDKPEKNCVETIVHTWGQPSEMYYHANNVLVMFFMVYETDDYVVVLSGNEYLTFHDNNVEIMGITICGKSSSGYVFDEDFYSRIE